MSVRWYESFIFVGMFLFNFAQCFSTNIARFSMTVLHAVVRSLTGMFGLCVLYSVLFFWGYALGLNMKDAYSFNNSPFLTDFFKKLFHFLNMWWSWIKMNSFKISLFKLLVCFFFIRFLINKYKSVTFILNSKNKFFIALFMLALHLFSACVSALLIVLLYFFRKVSLNISCSILDKNLSTLGIFHFVVILLLWLLIIGGFIPSLVSSFLLLAS